MNNDSFEVDWQLEFLWLELFLSRLLNLERIEEKSLGQINYILEIVWWEIHILPAVQTNFAQCGWSFGPLDVHP